MESKWLGRGALAALVVSVCGSSGLLSGCAEERDPINRVQAGALSKSFFLGPNLEDFKDDPEFRTKSYNIDSAANTDSHVGAIGGASAVERVRWEVTENFLFARRAYQESPGADNRGLPRKEVSPGKWEFPTAANGTIVAAYRIQGHFDVRRSYNPATGEEQNVIEENQSDRPWNKRQYMRVDWSKNVAESTSGDTSWVFGAGSDVTAIEYAQSNEIDEDRPHFEIGNGYFDITNKFQLKPSPVGGYGIPECVLVGFFNGTTSFDCTPTEVKVRSSYIRLTGDEDFEPFEENKTFRDVVGNWGNAGNNFNREYGGAPITAWDPQYGYTDAKTHTFYSFHNIWEKSHVAAQCGNNADEDKDGTADECQPEKIQYSGSLGSQCDVYIGRCTIPARDRKVKTFSYSLNADAPQDLTDKVAADGKTIEVPGPIEEMTITWNQLLKITVAYRREVECRRTHDNDRDTCHGLYFEGGGPEGKQMIKFGGWGADIPKALPVDLDKTTGQDTPVVSTCHNPVRAYDVPSCGKVGDVIRLGDIRRNFAIYWPYASRAPYGGVASIGGDPVTGEMLGVTATIMMRSATAAAAQQRDVLALAMGDVKVEDLIQGAQASTYASRVKDGKIVGGLAQAKTAAEIAAVTKNIDLASVQVAVGQSPAAINAISKLQQNINAALIRTQESPQSTNLAKANTQLETLMAKLNTTPYKTEVGNKGLFRLVAESADKSTNVYNSIKTFADQDPNRMQDIMDQYQAFLGAKGVCFADGPQNAGAGSIYQPALAPYFKQKYADLDPVDRGVKIYQDLLRESVKGIAFHEIGHSLGLRHNFSSLWDSLNYAPQYWQLRTKEGAATAECTQPRAEGDKNDNCMGPRYLDPLSDDEQGVGGESRPGLEYFANTSTMEYQIERFGETVGAGSYDLHAMKTLYGRVLETFDTRSVKSDQAQFFAAKMLSQGISKDLILNTAKNALGLHYTRMAVMAKVFDPARDCRPATDEEKETAKWRIVHGKVCSQGPRNHLAYEDLKSEAIVYKVPQQGPVKLGADGVHWKGLDENNQTTVRWPYRYGEDYSRGGYIHAKLFDSGADVYEITMNVIRRFDETYPWSYFRRQNKEFAWWGLSAGVANNTFSRMRAYHWSTTTDIGRSSAGDLEDDDQDRPSAMASQEMFNFLQRALLMPEVGSYGSGADTTRRTKPNGAVIFDVQSDREAGEVGTSIGKIGMVEGRYVNVDFDNSLGGSWDYQRYPAHAGFDDEKALAIRELVDSRPTLSSVSRDNALDGRDPYISFRTDTPHAIDRLLGGLLSDDWEAIGPSLAPSGTGIVTLNLQNRDPAAVVRPAGSKGIIFPNIGYSNQLAAGIYGLMYSRFSTDLVLLNKMRIRVDGDNGPTIPADRRVTFVDPVSGFTYMASKFGNETIGGRAVETGVASRMLQRANQLAEAAYEGSLGAGGTFTAILASGQPVIKDAAAEKEIRRYVGLLDAMRQVSEIFGAGPLGGGGGGGGGE